MSMDKQIMGLVNEGGQSADKITHALKAIGGGSMGAGVSKIAQYCQENGQRLGQRQGVVVGTAIGLTLSGIVWATTTLLKAKVESDASAAKEERRLLEELEAEMAESEEIGVEQTP